MSDATLVKHAQVRNVDWGLWKGDGGYATEEVTHALLMDIREELRALNRLLSCPNFTEMPATLRTIAKRLDGRTREGRAQRRAKL